MDLSIGECPLINLEEGLLDVRQSRVRGINGPVIKSPKANSHRIIALPSTVIEELKQYKIYREQNKERMKDKWTEKEREWIFCNPDGTHFYPNTPTTWWSRFIERTGVRHIRLHDLR